MADEWYEVVGADAPITQGDLIFDCPLIGWEAEALNLQAESDSEVLEDAVTAISADVVVMSQACDLEHHKVSNVILCPHCALTEYREDWVQERKNRNQNPTSKAWRGHCDDICDGFIWNLTMLNKFAPGELGIDIRVVDFHDVFSAPRGFLESLLKQRGNSRYRLLPPYREHLSQAFARFFMRVGLPSPVEKNW
jgi:hypothetical protein